MSDSRIGGRLREFHEYNVKPARNLLFQGELAFLAGAIVEEIIGRNPYFWYREQRGEDQFIKQNIRDHEMVIDMYDRGLSRHLFINGVHEAQAAVAYRDALTKVAARVDGEITILEVGANIGYYLLDILDLLGERAFIFAFEPDRANRSLLETNIDLNGYEDSTEIIPQAVDETTGVGTFCRSTHSNWNRLEQNRENGNDKLIDKYSVKTTSINDFLSQRDIEPSAINALRMDLEGSEISVLRGMEQMLSASGPLVIFVEFHPDFVDQSEYQWALTLLEKHEFEIEFVNQQRNVLDVDSFEELQALQGSHVRVIFSQNL